MHEQQLRQLQDAIGNIELTPAERRSIEWLAGWESETVENICRIIAKIKKEHPREEMPCK